MSSYVNTQLLECNRLHSEEAKSGNNTNTALFTNKLGSGIRLDVGDVVSVHAAYISDIGAAGDTIELTGTSSKLDAFLDAIEKSAVLETVRTGASGIGRGDWVLKV